MTTLLTSKEYATRLGIRSQTARRQRMTGRGPRFLRLGTGPSGRVYYREEDVLRWLAEQKTFSSTLEERQYRSGDGSHEVVVRRENRTSLFAVSSKGCAKPENCEGIGATNTARNHSPSVESDG
jgi:hypothetical protein